MAQIATINPLNQFFALNGAPLNSGKLYFGEANKDPEQFPVQMYWDSAGLVPALQPIRTTSGYPSRSGSPAILYSAVEYSLRVRQSNDAQVFYLPRAGSAGLQTFGQWQATSVTPSFFSANSFTLTGDQTLEFEPGRRARFAVTSGAVYGTIGTSVYGALTTITMVMDTGQALDAGLSSVDLSLLTATNSALPNSAASRASLGVYQAGYLFGCTMSTAGSSATMSIAAGAAMNSTSTGMMPLSAIAKTTSAWAVGTAVGGLDTGAIANNTGYHFFVIRRPDTGVVDCLFSLSATAPTLPANYTQFRRIGWGRTNGSAQWLKFIQDGDFFQWDAAFIDVATVGTGAVAVTRTLTVPAGVNVRAVFNIDFEGVGADLVLFSDLAVADVAPSVTTNSLAQAWCEANGRVMGQLFCRTNTSGQIRSRMATGLGSTTLTMATVGWFDRRGKDA